MFDELLINEKLYRQRLLSLYVSIAYLMERKEFYQSRGESLSETDISKLAQLLKKWRTVRTLWKCRADEIERMLA